MSFNNPTYIEIGRTGTYGGQTWRVIGRVVLGVNEDGDIYYWNEFNLENGAGENATLVFERTARGSEWRWFTQFEPEYPMTAADAATKEVGDILNFDGTDVRVTLLEQSRIYFVEGQAPPGERVGSVANYFNAENGDEMLVISWTGEEVEYYRGRTITNSEVRKAFQLNRTEHATVPAGSRTRYNRVEPSGFSWANRVPWLLIGVVGLYLTLVFGGRGCHSQPTAGIIRFTVPSSPLKIGARGRLAEVNYQITGQALLEVAEVNLRFGEQEYFLRDDQNGEALLIAGFIPGNQDWMLFTPLHPFYPITPYTAAAVKLGQIENVDGMVAPVDELFNASVLRSDFADTPELNTGDMFYGFAGKRDSEILLVTWNTNAISFWKGLSLSTQTVLKALRPAAAAK